MSELRLRAYFYRDNFRRLVFVNLCLSLIVLGLVGNLCYQFQLLIVPPVKHYVSTMNGRLIPLDSRLIKQH